MKRMKGFLAVFCTTMMMLTVPVLAAETDVTGDWYGDYFGAVMKMSFNEDGTYTLFFGDDQMDGTWELTDEGILMDEDQLLLITDEGLTYDSEEQIPVTFGRDVIEEFVPAEIDYEADPEMLQGRWSAYKVGDDTGFLDIDSENMLYMEMDIIDQTVTMNGFYFDNETFDMDLQDGGLSIYNGDDESAMFELMAVNFLEDGTLRLALVTSVEDNDQIIYLFVPAEDLENMTEAVTEKTD